MKHLENYNNFNHLFELKEGPEKLNQKNIVMCDDCKHQDNIWKFERIFSKKLKCPKCKSENIVKPEKPNLIPAPQPKR